MKKGTANRETKLLELKKKLAWTCCENLLIPPLPKMSRLEILKTDDEETRAAKQLEFTLKSNECERERIAREPELIRSFDRIIERVKAARSEYDSNAFSYVAVSEAYRTTAMFCSHCKSEKVQYITDRNGDSICTGIDGSGCGHILRDHAIHLGAAKRNFEGEEEKNTFGPTPNYLMPDSWNMSTSMSVLKNGRDDANYKRIAQTAQQVEMDLSNVGSDEHRTREGYKNKQKRKAFELLEHLADCLNVHESVTERAKLEFARYRDVREAIQQFEEVVAACMVLAYEELSTDHCLDVKEYVYTGPRLKSNVTATTWQPPKPSDIAESCLSEIPMSKWNLEEVRAWLSAMSRDSREQSFANAIFARVEQQFNQQQLSSSAASQISTNSLRSTPMQSVSSSSIAIKRKYPEISACFGTTTTKGRNKLLAAVLEPDQSSTIATASTPGQLLARIKLSTLEYAAQADDVMSSSNDSNTNESIERHFFEAIKRRGAYEIRRIEAQAIAEQEAKRIAIDVERKQRLSGITPAKGLDTAGAGKQTHLPLQSSSSRNHGSNIPGTNRVPLIAVKKEPSASTAASSSATTNSDNAFEDELEMLLGKPTLPAPVVAAASISELQAALKSTSGGSAGAEAKGTEGKKFKIRMKIE